jgi:GNAT superfamily N-acetyltransferase
VSSSPRYGANVPEIQIVRVTDDEGAAICELLFREYGQWSAGHLADDFDIVLSEDDLDEVHATFRLEQPVLFGSSGRLYLAKVDGAPAGAGALKPVGPDICEIKRMFVTPKFRRMGVARTILERLLSDARELGYRTARLETMTYMREAHDLYRSIGFVDSEPFEAEGSQFGVAQCELFMTLELQPAD